MISRSACIDGVTRAYDDESGKRDGDEMETIERRAARSEEQMASQQVEENEHSYSSSTGEVSVNGVTSHARREKSHPSESSQIEIEARRGNQMT